jgi:hypothetical protein
MSGFPPEPPRTGCFGMTTGVASGRIVTLPELSTIFVCGWNPELLSSGPDFALRIFELLCYFPAPKLNCI